ncbi:MAG: RND family transporter, partial [Fidelibacterota bacterium]
RIALDALREEFGNTNMIFMAFGKRGKSVFDPNTLALLWDVCRTLEELPEVDEVLSIATLNRMDSEEGFLEIGDLQPGRDLTLEEVDHIKAYLEKTPDMMKRVVGKHRDYLNVVIRPRNDAANDVLRNKVVNVAAHYLQGYDVHFGGQGYLTGTIPALIRNDVIKLMRAGLIIMVLVLLVNLRSVPAVGMILSVILLSLIAMLGFMGWVYRFTGSERFLFTMLNTSMPIILLTIANSDGVHIITKFFREFRRRRNVNESVQVAMNSLLLPVFLTSLTTMAAFLSMIFAPIEQMIGYGVSLSFGIAWAWFLSSIFLPALISVKKWKIDSRAVSHASVFESIIGRFGTVVISHTRTVLSVGVVIVSAGIAGLFLLNIEVNIATMFKPGTEIRDSIEFMDREMTGTMDLEIRVEGDLKAPATLNDMLAIQDYMEQHPAVSTTISIADVIKQMHRTVMDDDPAYETIPDSREKVNNLFTLYSMSGDPDDFSSLVDYDYRTGLLTALMGTI